MAMANGKSNTRKRRGLFSLFFPERIREWRCNECGRPFLEHPDREPTKRFVQGNVELLVYDDASAFRRDMKLRMGVWRKSLNDFTFCQLFASEDVEHLQRVVTKAVEFVKGCKEVEQDEAPEKMSSRWQ